MQTILPDQPSYYLLSNGKRYAVLGKTIKESGILVFTDRQQADQFCKTIGHKLPEYQPIEVSAADFEKILDDNGGWFCMRDAEKITVYKPRKRGGKGPKSS